VLQANRRLEIALKEADAEVERSPADIGARLIGAMAAQAAGNHDDAERRFREVLSADPGSRVAAKNLASIYLSRGENLVFAEQLARRAVEQQPDAEAFATLGAIALKQGMVGNAVKHFERAIGLEPHRAIFHYQLGLGYARNHEPDRARSALTEALRIDPRFTDAKTALASLPPANE
jgi:Tfp pilus assembly protein PilF